MLCFEWKLFLPLVWHSYHHDPTMKARQHGLTCCRVIVRAYRSGVHHQRVEVTIIPIGDGWAHGSEC